MSLIDNLGSHRKVNPPGEPIPRIQAYCYLCRSEHRYCEPCLRPVIEAAPTKKCAWCGHDFIPAKRRLTYCHPECRYQAKLARNRAAGRKWHGG